MCDYDITKQVYVVFFSIGFTLATCRVARRWMDPPVQRLPGTFMFCYFLWQISYLCS